MKKLLAALGALALSSPAQAEWRLDAGGAIVEPSVTNSTMELLALLCGDPVQVEIYSRGGSVQPETADAEQPVAAQVQADYFYLPGKVQAVVDGRPFPLTAAGSDAAVVLFSEGTKAQSYMAPLRPDFIDALKTGKELTIGFDITPANGADGSPFETTAAFPLDGSAAVIEEALRGCS